MNHELDKQKDITGLDIHYYIINKLGEKFDSCMTHSWTSYSSRGQIVIAMNGKIYRIKVTTEDL